MAVTGSDTSANALFGALQVQTAASAGLDPVLLAAANTSGGVLGKMVSPQNLAIAAAAVGMAGREGDIFRKVFGWSIGLLLFMCGSWSPAVHGRPQLDGALTDSHGRRARTPSGVRALLHLVRRAVSVQVEHVLEPDGEPGAVANGAEPGEDPRRERRPVQGVVADGQGLPQPAEHDLLVGDQAPDAQAECTGTPSTSAPRAPSRPVEVASGIGALPASRRAAAMSSAVRRAVPDGASALSGWCSSTTSTDSKNGAACAANRIIRIAPMEKLGAISTPDRGASPSQLAQLVQTRVVEARGADDRVDAVLDAEGEVVHHHVGVREVDDRLRPGRDQGADVVAGVDLRHQLHVRGRLDRRTDLRADLAARTQDTDQQLLTHGSNLASKASDEWRWLTREPASGRL